MNRYFLNLIYFRFSTSSLVEWVETFTYGCSEKAQQPIFDHIFPDTNWGKTINWLNCLSIKRGAGVKDQKSGDSSDTQ